MQQLVLAFTQRVTGLVDFRATAVDQKREHDDEEYSGNNPNNGDIVHVISPYFLVSSNTF
jgi:hypothetical protein